MTLIAAVGMASQMLGTTGTAMAQGNERVSPPRPLGVDRITSSDPPPSEGYFDTIPVGHRRSLPSGDACVRRVHRSRWEPRPDNTKRDNVMPDPPAVRESFAARPRSREGAYAARWDSWLLPRVDGQFTGTTDEIFQWAACKWGLRDNLFRAIAVRESAWYQYETYPGDRCVVHYGCGDLFSSSSPAAARYCQGIAKYGYDYQGDFGKGMCPKTFSIMGVMSWQAPGWGEYPGNQNGTFPFARDSTGFSADYIGAALRGCYEGWEWWLDNTGTRDYGPGDIWGCVGAWYAGAWHSPAANGYLTRVRDELQAHTWLRRDWSDKKPPCDEYGCPGPDGLRGPQNSMARRI